MIDDDGPGMPDSECALFNAGDLRMDKTDPNHGLGLLIARDIALAGGGAMLLEAAPLGGLRVRLAWGGTSVAAETKG